MENPEKSRNSKVVRESQGKLKKKLMKVLLLGIITSAKEVMFLPDFVCLSVCVLAK